jgi:(2Fe-2S) ferredoxin
MGGIGRKERGVGRQADFDIAGAKIGCSENGLVLVAERAGTQAGFQIDTGCSALCACAPILILRNTGSVALMPSIERGMVFLFVVFIARCGQGYTFVVMSVGSFLDGETMNNADHINNRAETARQIVGEMPVGELAKSMTGLKPKGACWYCNQPLDNVRRFCNKTCAEDYRTEEEAFRDSSK